MSSRVVFASVLACSTVSLSQPRDDRALIDRGRALRREGRNTDALVLFRQAYALRATPESAGQLGFAEHALGHWLSASNHLREALSASTDRWVLAQRAALEFSLSRVEAHLGQLIVETDAQSGTVTLSNGAPIVLPMASPVRVEEGPVFIETRAPGRRADRREVAVRAGESLRVVVSLSPEVNTEVPHTARTEPVARAQEVPQNIVSPARTERDGLRVSTDVLTERNRARPSERPGSVTRTLAWVSTVGAALSIGTGFFAMALRDAAADTWNDDAQCLGNHRTREENCGTERESVSTMQGLMLGSFIAGGAFAVGAVVLFLAAPRATERPVRLGFDVGPGHAGLSFHTRF